MEKQSALEEVFARRRGWASEVVDGFLWLGSGTDASNRGELESRGITRILNVADDVENFHEKAGEPSNFVYKNLNVADFGQDAGISRVFAEAFEFLNEVKQGEHRVLVHCAAGANRSATVVLAWLMYSQSMPLFDAWRHLKSRRRGVCPQTDNRLQLINFEKSLTGHCSFESDSSFLTMR